MEKCSIGRSGIERESELASWSSKNKAKLPNEAGRQQGRQAGRPLSCFFIREPGHIAVEYVQLSHYFHMKEKKKVFSFGHPLKRVLSWVGRYFPFSVFYLFSPPLRSHTERSCDKGPYPSFFPFFLSFVVCLKKKKSSSIWLPSPLLLSAKKREIHREGRSDWTERTEDECGANKRFPLSPSKETHGLEMDGRTRREEVKRSKKNGGQTSHRLSVSPSNPIPIHVVHTSLYFPPNE